MSIQDFMQEYVVEVGEHLQELERSLLILEREGADADNGGIGEIFRAAHSIKGLSSYMGYERLANLTHELESLISAIQAGKRSVTPQGVNAILGCVDFISGALKTLQENGEEPPFPTALLQELRQALSAEASGTSESAPDRILPGDVPAPNDHEDYEKTDGAPTAFEEMTETEPEEEYEEDQELLSIFLDSFQDAFSQLVNLFFSCGEAPPSKDHAEALLKRLIASSRYMSYTHVADTLEELERTLGVLREEDYTYWHHYGELIVNCGRCLRQSLPALKIPTHFPLESTAATRQEGAIIQEEDEELFAIFMDSFQDILSRLRNMLPSSPGLPLEDEELEQIRRLLGKLASSSRYMNYDSVASVAGEWEEKLIEAGKNGVLDEKLYEELFEAFGHRLQTLLPGPASRSSTTFPGPEDSAIANTIEQELNTTFENLDSSLLSIGFDTDHPQHQQPASGDDDDVRPLDMGSMPPFQRESAGSPLSVSMSMEPAGGLKALLNEPSGSAPQETARERSPITAITEEMSLEATLRVNARKVDELLNQVGELVVSRSEFMQTAAFLKETIRELTARGRLTKQELKRLRMLSFRLNESTLYMGRITKDLQNSVMRVRMLPISHLFRRFPRIVRDQAMKLGKRVELILDGGETEVDKRVLEQMNDPIVQFLRNATAHGIESIQERRSLGKAETGAIRLNAHHEGDQVVLEIEDDGRGIDCLKLRRALQNTRGMAAQELERLSDREIIYAVFLPGISTHDRVDGTAGRGVGLDVVKENVERLNGSIEVESEPGAGTRFTIRIPLTVAIIRALLVKVMDQVFTLPLASVSEIIRYEAERIYSIESFHVISIRDKTIPLVHLSRLLGMRDSASDAGGSRKFVVVVNTSFQEVGLVVDSLVDEREVVIKPIEDECHSFDGFSGATILGDGSVSLILDVSALLGTIKDVRCERGRN